MNEIYKIIKIIDEYEVVINVGSTSGFKIGDTFEIFVVGDIVFDPDTNKPLGTLDFIKARIKIKNLYEKMAVCTNVRNASSSVIETVNLLTLGGGPQPLKVDTLQISGGYSEDDRTIKVGDLVRPCLNQ